MKGLIFFINAILYFVIVPFRSFASQYGKKKQNEVFLKKKVRVIFKSFVFNNQFIKSYERCAKEQIVNRRNRQQILHTSKVLVSPKLFHFGLILSDHQKYEFKVNK